LQFRRHINLVTALIAEAKPLIDSFELRRLQPIGPLPLYQSSDILLVVAGLGVDSVSNGVAYLAEMTPPGSKPVWLNFGICGHGTLNVGELLVIDTAIDQSGDSWKLNSHSKSSLQHGPLTCVSQPQTSYQAQMAYDMESAGFLSSMTSITTLDDVHILKIVSDNPENGIETINAKQVRNLVTAQLNQISEFMMRVTTV
jgi:adenosylhomocysteine nucleosidase